VAVRNASYEFARIAAAHPSLVILDEPMGGVNPVLGERIGQAVRSLIGQWQQRRGR